MLNIAYGNAELQRQICFNKVYDDDDDDDDDEQALSEWAGTLSRVTVWVKWRGTDSKEFIGWSINHS